MIRSRQHPDYIPLNTNGHYPPPPPRVDTSSPPASAYFDEHGILSADDAEGHFSFSTTLRRHTRVWGRKPGEGWREWIARMVVFWRRENSRESGSKLDPETESASASAVWCARTIEETVNHFRTSATHGLSPSSIPSLQSLHGYNEFTVPPSPPLPLKFLAQITDSPLIILLLLSALVSAFVGNTDDAISIVVAVSIVLTVGYVQERRSERSLEALGMLVPHGAMVIRGFPPLGFTDVASEHPAPVPILANDLVPGDLISLTTGSRVPADVRLIHSVGLEVDESSLTGENASKPKSSEYTGGSVDELAERKNIVHMGTLVKAGYARGIVVGIGSGTEFGKVWEVVRATPTPRTPLQEQMDELAKKLSAVSFGIIGILVLIGIFQGRAFLEMFTVGVSLAVAAIPEGLPIVTTVTLALGVLRMSKKKCIVKRLPGVECLGCVAVIGVDKTGTLTMNEMRVSEIWTPSTSGTATTSVPIHNSASASTLSDPAKSVLSAAIICNNATRLPEGGWTGQSTDVGIRLAGEVFASALGDVAHDTTRWTRKGEKPFSSDDKWMWVSGIWGSERSATPSAIPNGRARTPTPSPTQCAYAKGALEMILPLCATYMDGEREKGLDDRERERTWKAAEAMSRRGLRVLGVASSTSMFSLPGNSDPKNLTFLGLLALHDPPRPGVRDAVKKLQNSSVKVVMITGDGEGTALAIAQEVGIVSATTTVIPGKTSGIVMTGAELDKIDVEELGARIESVKVWARMTPKHKMRIVEGYKSKGVVVGMTGDGVNDAPALKRADIGISMGGKGATDVAKEAADVILVDDEFGTILAGVEEGKSIFHNIQNFLSFQLSTAIAALSLITLSTVFHLANPLNAMQILFINILMDGPPSQSLGVDPVDPSVMRRPPRRKDEPIITKRLLGRVGFSASMIILGTLWVYLYALSDERLSHRDQTMTFSTFVFLDLVSALQNRSLHCSITSNKMLLITVLVSFLTQLGLIYLPLMQRIFQTESLNGMDLTTVGVLAMISWCLHEFRRIWERRRERWELIAMAGSGSSGVELDGDVVSV